MKITKCPHANRKHYAKNMCSSCYRKYGRNQNAWNCAHKDRLLYSMGMCQTCYLSDYHKRKNQEMEKQANAPVQATNIDNRENTSSSDQQKEGGQNDILSLIQEAQRVAVDKENGRQTRNSFWIRLPATTTVLKMSAFHQPKYRKYDKAVRLHMSLFL